MCGRYARWTSRRDFAGLAGLPVGALPYGETIPSWNVAPGRACAVVRHELGGAPSLDQLTWGFIPHWADEPPGRRPINARIETAATSPMFRRCFRYRRCLVAADGWYEWVAGDPQEGKQPYFHCLSDGRPFFFGGLWDNYWAGPDRPVQTFAILTRPSVRSIAGIHNRMPVILSPDHFVAWLDKTMADPAAILALATGPDDIVAYPVSRAVNRASADGPELIEPVPR